MFFGKKENKKLPDLPPPKISFGGTISNPIDDEDSSLLPAFPDSPDHNRFSQAAIKDAVSYEPDEDDSPKKSPKIVEMEEWRPSSFRPEAESEEHAEIDDEEEEEEPKFVNKEYKPLPRRESRMEEDYREKSKDIFVKIDKFHSARRSLNEVKDKFEEINSFIRKIREVKLREEQELAAWEKDMTQVKSRIQHVTENIFEKID